MTRKRKKSPGTARCPGAGAGKRGERETGRHQGRTQRHDQRHRAAGQRLQEDRFARHQPVTAGAGRDAGEDPGGDRRVRLRTDPQARGLAFRSSFLIGLIYDNPNAQYIVNLMEGVLDAVRNTEYEARRPSMRPHDRTSSPACVVRRTAEAVRRSCCPQFGKRRAHAALAAADCAYVRITYAVLDDAARMRDLQRPARGGRGGKLPDRTRSQRIGYIAGPPGFRSAGERLAGFREALEAHVDAFARRAHRRRRLHLRSGVAGRREAAGGPTRGRRRSSPATTRWRPASTVSREETGLAIPGDLSIVGFDDSPLASRLLPSMTTVRLPIRESAGSPP